ncbi:membrane protein insertion efficiency factor YidD [Gordonia rhizosphera]|uniref:Putative membrane protein insertion efficiency factor n=1 Tax=Gordonia rhizosphera NBRC 16068 TaxID=1108045 RepID=K6X1T8_9ACTN|nr:membrane protein insertion efficiency factor YidD [Gordonia rhizosphera]GAB92764.1 putative membrane protein insertion efficiency factor [Gordonia rhizosphera NBRC 16068]
MTAAHDEDPVAQDSQAQDSVTQESPPAGPAPAGVRARLVTWLHLLPRRSVVFLIELYRTWISPLRLPTCRFEPTCSAYAVEALTRHGFLYGGWLSVVRLLKCGPWHKPGYDPVPDRGFRELFTRSDESSAVDTSTVSTSTEVRGN